MPGPDSEGEAEPKTPPTQEMTGPETIPATQPGSEPAETEFEAKQGEGGPKFIKGDLVYPGTRRILSRYDHVGVALGAEIIDTELYANVSPWFAWYFDSGFAMSFHVPLRLQTLVINQTDFEFGGLKLRRQDWDEIPDFAKVVRFVTYGRKEANIYATINTLRPYTIGHGLLMNRYQGDIDVDRSLTGLEFDAYNEYAGFQLLANDVTFQNRIFGGLAFVKPLSFFMDGPYAEGFSMGGEYMADLRAPKCILKSAGSNECMRGSGHSAGRDPYSGEGRDDTFVRSDPDTGRFAVKETTVHAVGVSTEFKFYKDDRNVDLKGYGTWHKFLNPGGGQGFAFGVLARLNFGDDWINALRLRGEYRTFGDGFLPQYFDTLYEVQKYAFLYRQRDYQAAPTKYQWVFGDPDNGFERREIGQRHGFRLEASWALFEGGRSNKKLGLGVGLQDSTGPNDTNFYLHLESPWLGFIQLFGTYMRTNVRGMDVLFSEIASQDVILLSGIRFQILPILFINAHYSRSFSIVRTPGSEYHLGNETIVDGNDEPSPFFEQDRLYENVQTLFVEIEFGWEFDDE